jgi:NhaP-type Na+/H+ or K+/H+ antiporter
MQRSRSISTDWTAFPFLISEINFSIKRETSAVHYVSHRISYVHNHGAFAMQKDSRTPTSIQLVIHCGMGVMLGALLGLALIVTNQNIFQFIVSSSSPLMNMAVFVGFFSFVVGTGATVSGVVFTALELNALEAKRQTQRIRQRRGQDGH